MLKRLKNINIGGKKMKTDIIAKNYQVNEKLGAVIEKKTAKLNKYFDDDTRCAV